MVLQAFTADALAAAGIVSAVAVLKIFAFVTLSHL
jgi:hypothetical protein